MTLRGITKDWTPADGPEGTVYLGNERGTWPILVFPSETHAAAWVGKDPDRRRVWVADVKVLYEVEYVPPGQAQLRPKDGTA